MLHKIGYTTGTFDLLHEGHFELLKKCKFYCDKLIVGLVTDELGIRQKRKPVLTFSHRKTLLEHSKYVDAVVEFNGTTKQQDYNKLKFNVLFICDEYETKHEYTSFEKTHSHIPIIYIPRTTHVSTSDIYKTILNNAITNFNVRASSICGDILSLSWKNNENIIIKPIKLSYKDSLNTDNNYNLSMPPPRNWKMLNSVKKPHPMISGVNPMREISIFNILKDKPWYPVLKFLKKNKTDKVYSVNECDDIRRMLKERNLGQLYWAVQKDGGETLTNYIKTKTEPERLNLYKRIKLIIDEMRELDVLHMDLHPDNILVSPDDKISIIDFGWCLHKNFDMNENEKKYYKECFDNNFDLTHFLESLIFMNIEIIIPTI